MGRLLTSAPGRSLKQRRPVLLRVDGSFYPNQEGSEDKRLVESLTADELKFVNAASTAGGRTEAVFRRAKVARAIDVCGAPTRRTALLKIAAVAARGPAL